MAYGAGEGFMLSTSNFESLAVFVWRPSILACGTLHGGGAWAGLGCWQLYRKVVFQKVPNLSNQKVHTVKVDSDDT